MIRTLALVFCLLANAVVAHSTQTVPRIGHGLDPWLQKISAQGTTGAELLIHPGGLAPDQTQTLVQGRYDYSTENVATLGQTCRNTSTERVIKPVGVNAATGSRRAGSALPLGLWEMRVDDYASILVGGYDANAVLLYNRSGIVAAYDACPEGSQMAALDRAMVKAVFP